MIPDKPYQVASTTDPSLPYRKWNHHGTCYAPTHRSAAYNTYKGNGDIIDELTGSHGVIFRFSCGLSVSVGL
jgi:hypothetical protein